MKERIWHKGPPPHVGWWNASVYSNENCWRWWDGSNWSGVSYPALKAETAAHYALTPAAEGLARIFWTDYWPENARVPRVDPRRADDVKATMHTRNDEVQRIFRANCVSYSGNYEVTPGQALRIAVLMCIDPPRSMT